MSRGALWLRRTISSALLGCSSLTVLSQAHAAPPTPVHWAVKLGSEKPVAPTKEFSLLLSAQIDSGWHIYATDEPEGGPQPTEIGLAEGDPLTLLNVKAPFAKGKPDPVTHQPVGMFQNAVAFVLRVRAPRAEPVVGATSHVLVRYQTCNDQVCLPPRTDTIVVLMQSVLSMPR